MRTLVIIPCRYNSSRFPGKSLAKFKGIPLVQRVYEQVKKSSVVDHVIIATDDKRIYDFAKEINADCSYSLKKYENGSERCFDVIKENYDEYDFFINVQGDIAVFNPREIDELCLIFKKEKPQIITIANKIINELENSDRDIVKVSFNKNKMATSFYRDSEFKKSEFKHRGIYGFNKSIVHEISNLKPDTDETRLNLEQLRWIKNDFQIRVVISDNDSHSIDRIEDLNKSSLLSDK